MKVEQEKFSIFFVLTLKVGGNCYSSDAETFFFGLQIDFVERAPQTTKSNFYKRCS